MDDNERLARVEKQVDILRRAIGLLTVSGAPTVEWMDATFAKLDEPHDSREQAMSTCAICRQESCATVHMVKSGHDFAPHDGTPEWDYLDCSGCGGAQCGNPEPHDLSAGEAL